jgi:hypothetical protein
MNDAFIKRTCSGCKHSVMQLTPDGSVRVAVCSHARDTSSASVKSRPRSQDAKQLVSCPLDQAVAA